MAKAAGKGIRTLCLGVVSVLLAADGTAAQSASIAISRNADLRFGQLVAGASSGTVTIATTGVRSASGGALLGNGTAVSAASFTVTGEPLSTYAITLPGPVTLSSGAQTATLNAFTSDPSGVGALDASGEQTVVVGATMEVGAGQTSGAYTGSFLVRVDYN